MPPYTRSIHQYTSIPSSEFDALVAAHDIAVSQADFYRKEAFAATQTIEGLRAEIARLNGPRVRSLVITKETLKDLAGITLENGLVEPDDKQYAAMRALMKQAAGMGFNAARWFLNAGEVRDMLALPDTSLGHLPAFARSVGLTFVADTVDRVVFDALAIEDSGQTPARERTQATMNLKAYLEGLVKLGAKAFYCNDASSYTRQTVERIVARLRSITPAMPLIASLSASDKPDDYKPLFDHIEAQTFGTADELTIFLGRDFDVFVLDARAKVVRPTYIAAMRNIVLKANPSAFFVYSDTVYDWSQASMIGNVKVIAEMVQAWKKLA